MLDLELLDESGYLEDDPTVIEAPVSLTQADIRSLQLAKSAICAGLSTLLEHEDLKPSDIPVLLVAGGFGNALHFQSASRIGLFPKELAKCARSVGNAALAGASLLLLNTSARQSAHDLASCANAISLAESQIFQKKFVQGMIFS